MHIPVGLTSASAITTRWLAFKPPAYCASPRQWSSLR